MPRKSSVLSVVRGRVARVTRLDACGRPVIGEYSQAVSDGVVSVSFTPNTTESDEINVTNMSGKRCVYEPSITDLSGYSIELVFCGVEFEVFEIITGQTIVLAADGSVVGIEMDTKISLEDRGFGFELWSGAGVTDACLNPNADGEFGYTLLPRLQGGILGEFTVENGAANFTITGAATRDGNQWGAGPYAVDRNASGLPSKLFQPLSSTAALRLQLVTVAPPEPFVGARPLLDPLADALTDITATRGATANEADFSTTRASTGPVWWDFGDGEWDYVAAPGEASHEYAAAGSYEVRASQNGVNWTSKTVTIPFP